MNTFGKIAVIPAIVATMNSAVEADQINTAAEQNKHYVTPQEAIGEIREKVAEKVKSTTDENIDKDYVTPQDAIKKTFKEIGKKIKPSTDKKTTIKEDIETGSKAVSEFFKGIKLENKSPCTNILGKKIKGCEKTSSLPTGLGEKYANWDNAKKIEEGDSCDPDKGCGGSDNNSSNDSIIPKYPTNSLFAKSTLPTYYAANEPEKKEIDIFSPKCLDETGTPTEECLKEIDAYDKKRYEESAGINA